MLHPAHDFLSGRLLIPAARFQRFLRPSRRAAVLAFYKGMHFRKSAVAWSAEKKTNWILDRLRTVARTAAQDTVYYRRLFDEIGFDPHADFSFDDYAKLPILERQVLVDHGSELISQNIPKAELRPDSTGGSTGAPVHIWKGPEERGWGESGIESFMQQVGVRPGTRTAYFWGHHLDVKSQPTLLERYHQFELNVRWFDCFRLSDSVLARYHDELTKWRPTCIVAYASALASLAEFLKHRKIRPDYPNGPMITGAEKLLPSQREVIEEVFQRAIHERYGSRDVGGIGFQLNPEMTLAYQIDWADFLVEPENGTESAIIITKLHGDGMPMLRYRIGDIGSFPRESKSGWPVFELDEVIGRITDRILLQDGRWIHGIQIPHLMKDYPVREFMCIQRSDYSVEVQIVPHPAFTEENRLTILRIMQANLPGLNISTELVEVIPRQSANKWRPVISEVRESQ